MEDNERMPSISVGILAGGKSSRMGTNKALLEIENESMLSRLCHEFDDFGEVLVSCAHANDYADLGVPLVADVNREIGPIEGIRRVLAEASGEFVFICAADMPFITKDLARYLASFISSDYDCYVAADEDHVHPLCAIYRRSVLEHVERMVAEGRFRIRDLFRLVSVKYVNLADSRFDKRVVRNVNTREDYVQVFKPFVLCVSGYSDSGKTFLIERLVNEFIEAGFSVGTCKHDGHDAYEDLPGSDTYRFIRAGASVVSIFSDTRFSIHVNEPPGCGKTASVRELIRRMTDVQNPPDFVIVEGLKDSDVPKVVIIRESDDWPDPNLRGPYVCMATDHISQTQTDCPVYGRDDVRGIFLCVLEYFNVWRSG